MLNKGLLCGLPPPLAGLGTGACASALSLSAAWAAFPPCDACTRCMHGASDGGFYKPCWALQKQTRLIPAYMLDKGLQEHDVQRQDLPPSVRQRPGSQMLRLQKLGVRMQKRMPECLMTGRLPLALLAFQPCVHPLQFFLLRIRPGHIGQCHS